jgi:hypothetical protein
MTWLKIHTYKNMDYISHSFLKFKYFNRNSLGDWFDI